jgi:hypothetical protein
MKHEVTLTLSVTVSGDDKDWKETLQGQLWICHSSWQI